MNTNKIPAWVKLQTIVIGSLLLVSLPAQGATDAEKINVLQSQVQLLTKRLALLESQVQPAQSIPVETYATPQKTRSTSASERDSDVLQFKGDFRFRSESFWIDNKDDRHRQRIRARAALTAKISNTLTAGFGLASGGDDPLSTNQTLGEAGSSKNVVKDLAYIDWETPFNGVDLTIGKFKNPLYRVGGSALLWDGDLRPEGAGITYRGAGVFANGVVVVIDEDAKGEDSFLLGTQFGLKRSLGNGQLTAGLGYYNFTGLKGNEVPYDGDPRGNRVNPDGTYATDFRIVEAFAAYSFALANNNVTLFSNFINNTAAKDYDTGYVLGARMKHDAWSLGWSYQDLEADATLGMFTDSDFSGGGTDGRGHLLRAGYALTSQVSINSSLFINERNVDFGETEDYKRLMLDLSFKY